MSSPGIRAGETHPSTRLLDRLLRLAGRSSTPDRELPTAWVVAEIIGRAVDFARGTIKMRAPCFMGPRVRVRGRRQLRIGRFAAIGAHSLIEATGRSGVHLGAGSRLGRFCTVLVTSHVSLVGEGFVLGARSGIGDFAHIGAAGGVRIGSDVIAGPYVSFHSQEHRFQNPDVTIRSQGTVEEPILVGDDVWIGAKATFLSGASVGDGCVVAAGSVVRDEFPPRCILAGVPARVVGQRGVGPGA